MRTAAVNCLLRLLSRADLYQHGLTFNSVESQRTVFAEAAAANGRSDLPAASLWEFSRLTVEEWLSGSRLWFAKSIYNILVSWVHLAVLINGVDGIDKPQIIMRSSMLNA